MTRTPEKEQVKLVRKVAQQLNITWAEARDQLGIPHPPPRKARRDPRVVHAEMLKMAGIGVIVGNWKDV